jgi:hypothetical protein
MYLTQEQIIHIEQNKRASYHWVYHGLVFPKALQLRICVLMLDDRLGLCMREMQGLGREPLGFP